VITLTAIQELMYGRFEVMKVLVIAPKRVAEDTWTREHEKWDHLRELRISKVLGTPAQRMKALKAEADIYVIGRDNVKWLVELMGKSWPFDMVVIDELSSFKNPSAQRFKALRKVIPASDRVVGLTGTPSPNGLMDLWSEIYLLDRGARLGPTISAYREKYFRAGARNGYTVYKWEPYSYSQKEIERKISDICMSMSAEDYLELPERMDNEIKIRLSPKEMKQYNQMEREQLLRIDDEAVVALNAAAVMNKLLQMANGSVYADGCDVVKIHEKKLDALEEIIDTTGEPVLVFYSFRHDLEAIKKRIPDARELEDIARWNRGEIPVLLCHPASVGYGLNLQDGGHVIVWYGLTWSLELYQQANARLYRQGQQKAVIIHHLIAEGTVDEQVMRALQHKDTSQSALLAALKERANV
jgi:SNF2 family DNA or RNA helicase